MGAFDFSSPSPDEAASAAGPQREWQPPHPTPRAHPPALHRADGEAARHSVFTMPDMVGDAAAGAALAAAACLRTPPRVRRVLAPRPPPALCCRRAAAIAARQQTGIFLTPSKTPTVKQQQRHQQQEREASEAAAAGVAGLYLDPGPGPSSTAAAAAAASHRSSGGGAVTHPPHRRLTEYTQDPELARWGRWPGGQPAAWLRLRGSCEAAAPCALLPAPPPSWQAGVRTAHMLAAPLLHLVCAGCGAGACRLVAAANAEDADAAAGGRQRLHLVVLGHVDAGARGPTGGPWCKAVTAAAAGQGEAASEGQLGRAGVPPPPLPCPSRLPTQFCQPPCTPPAGKSTLMGRLLHDLGLVSQKEVHRNQRDAAAAGKAGGQQLPGSFPADGRRLPRQRRQEARPLTTWRRAALRCAGQASYALAIPLVTDGCAALCCAVLRRRPLPGPGCWMSGRRSGRAG
jgi:hypothetical protein